MNGDPHDRALYAEAVARGLLADVDAWQSATMVGGYPNEDLSHVTEFVLTGDAKEKQRWCSTLPAMTKLKSLWVKTSANQRLFDVICGLTQLERVAFWQTSIAQCNALEQLQRVIQLALGSCPRLPDIGPIGAMQSLRALNLQGNFGLVRDLEPLAALPALQGLTLGGLWSRRQRYSSLRAVGELDQLVYLRMYWIVLDDGDLAPLEKLTNLEYLFMDDGMLKQWTRHAFRRLHEALPRLRNRLLERAATDAAFQRAHGIQ